MGHLKTVEIKAFLPAKDFELSKQFYKDFGFSMNSMSNELAYFHCDGASFLLQNYYVKEWAENFMMHILVEDVQSWWDHVVYRDLANKYGVLIEPLRDKPWAMRDFAIADPSGVLWRVGQNIEHYNSLARFLSS